MACPDDALRRDEPVGRFGRGDRHVADATGTSIGRSECLRVVEIARKVNPNRESLKEAEEGLQRELGASDI